MEEIKFKPSTKNNKLFLLIGILICFTIILLPIGIGMIAYNLIRLITKRFYEFKIRDNELEIYYQFISKTVKVYRIDQITSINLVRSWTQKWFGLGSVKFGIFGQTNLMTAQANQNQQQQIILNEIFDVAEYSQIFNTLCERLDITNNTEIYEDKPIPRAQKFWKNLWLVFSLIFYGLGIISIFTSGFNSDKVVLGLMFTIPGTLFLLFFIIMLFEIKKIKSMKYTIKESSMDKYFDYVFRTEYTKVPIKKITNTEIYKNIISWKLFKIGTVKIFTGGNNDPYLNNLEKFAKFHQNLSNKIRNVPISEKANVNDLGEIKNSPEINKDVKPEFVTKPGKSFFITTLFWSSIILLPIFIITFSITKSLFSFIIIIIYLLIILMRYLLWKNTTYEFYEDRVVDISGVINITTKEIRFVNIKYIALSRQLFFDKIFNQGTIHIFTAGTSFLDNRINSLKEYQTVYKELRELIKEENK